MHHPPAQVPAAKNLVHEIAAVYGLRGQRTSFGAGGQPVYPPTVVETSPLPQSLLQLYSGLNHSGTGRTSAGLNHPGAAARLPIGYNRPNGTLAGFNHSGTASEIAAGGVPSRSTLNNPGTTAETRAGVCHPRIAPFTNAGSSQQQVTSTDSSTYFSPATQACVSTRASLSHTSIGSSSQLSAITNSPTNAAPTTEACFSKRAPFPKQPLPFTNTESSPPLSTVTNSSSHSSLATQVCASNKASMSKQPSLMQKQLISANTESSNVGNVQSDSAPQQNSNSEIGIPQSSPEGKGDDVSMKSREARWIVRYNELLEFRVEHGHCRVPHGYCQNRKLSWWVMNQRAQFAHRNQGKKTWLTDKRIQLLNDVGFIWTPHVKRSSAGKTKEIPTSSGKERFKSKDGENTSLRRTCFPEIDSK